jgi:hypothetical protein
MNNFRPRRAFSTMPTDRGSLRGARRCIVDADLNIIDHDVAKAARITGVFFQSRHEAKHYVALEAIAKHGMLKPLPGQSRWRQVRFPLFAIRPDGLKEKVCDLVLDFAYLLPKHTAKEIFERGLSVDAWEARYEDCKPAGGLREDAWLLKKKWFEVQYGITIAEV